MRKRHLPPVLRGLVPVLLAALLGGCGAAQPSSEPAAEPERAHASVSSAAAPVAPEHRF